MEKILKLFLILVLTVNLHAATGADLSDLEKKAKEKEEELKKIKEEEERLAKELSTLERKQLQAQQMINKIEKDISTVEQRKITTANKKEALERSQPVWQDSLERESAIYVAELLASPAYFESDDIKTNIFMSRVLDHKAAFTVELKKENKLAKERIDLFEERNRALQEETSRMTQQRSLITKDFQKTKVDLSVNQKKYEAAQKELSELNKSAKEMKELLAAAEEKRKKAAAKAAKEKGAAETAQKAEIAAPGSLPYPVSGEIFSKFGKEYNSSLNTYIFRDGVKISAKKGETVYSVAEGTVIYAGAFRSYGNVIIIDHGKGFFTIYGYLSVIDVDKGDSVGSKTPIGVAGVDNHQGSMGSGRTALYFEVRQGATAVDPQQFLVR